MICGALFKIVRLLDIVNPPEGAKLDDVYLVQELMDTDLRKVIYSMQPLDEDHTQYFIYQVSDSACSKALNRSATDLFGAVAKSVKIHSFSGNNSPRS